MYNQTTINAIRDLLVNAGETIAVAESVTSGHLQAALSSGEEASKYFQGGLTAYNAGQKTRHLNIEPIYANKVNCVADKIASAMAIEVSKLFISDYGIGITGYATIVPECEKEGLFAWFAIAYKKEVVLLKKITTAKLGINAQINYTEQVIEQLYDFISKK
ncbi:MAG TPA: nicotinamide-nucleotide amidohydrolase family protein [Segetibacter sp.]